MIGRLLQFDNTLDDHHFHPRAFAHSTQAGPRVDVLESMTLPAMFCALNSLATHIAMLPLPVLRKTGPKKWERDEDDNVHFLLNVEANPEMSSFNYRRSLVLQTEVYGNGVGPIQRQGVVPEALWLTDPRNIRLKRSKTTGELVYEIVHTNRDSEFLPARNVLHPSGLGFDGIVGLGLIENVARENLGWALAIAQYAQSFFGNNTVMGAMISFPNTLGPEAMKDWTQQIREAHQGPDKAFGLLAVDGGAKIEQMGSDNQAAQTLELMTFSVQDVSRWTGVPPPLLHDLSRGTFTNSTEVSIWYVKYGLAPKLKMYETEFKRKLFPRSEWGTVRLKHIAEGLLRGDAKARGEFYASMQDHGVFTINDVLEREDMNGIGPAGDKHWVELNRAPVEDAAEQAAERDAEQTATVVVDDDDDEAPKPNTMAVMRDAIAKAHEPLLASVYGRMLKIQERACGRAQTQHAEKWLDWLSTYYDGHSIVLRDAVSPVFDALGGAIKATMSNAMLEAEWDLFVGLFTKQFVENATRCAQSAICEYGLKAFSSMNVQTFCLEQYGVSEFIEQATERFGCEKQELELCSLTH